MGSLMNYLEAQKFIAEIPDRQGNKSGDAVRIQNAIDEAEQLQSTITAQEDIIKRLREKVERAFYDGIQRAYTVEIKGGTTGWLEVAKEYAHSVLMNEVGEK